MTSKKKNVDDRISNLPEEIRSHLLSLMPMKFAVQTSSLSKSWKNSWISVNSLDIDDYNIYDVHVLHSLQNVIDRVLNSSKTSRIKLLRLHFLRIEFSESSVLNWINEAVRLNVHELDIHVFKLKLPSSLFTCKTLTKLRLDESYNDWECSSLVNLPFLKTLEIADYYDPFVNAFKLVRGCPMLESLSLRVSFCDVEKDYIFNIPTLKQLKLTVESVRRESINKVVIHVPNLEYVYVCGILCSFFVMKDVPFMVEACVMISFETYDHVWVEFLKSLSGVKSLSIKKLPSTTYLPVFPNMKHLELKTFWYSGQILQVLESCPVLEHLSIEKSGKTHWIEPEAVPICMLTNLTTMKISFPKWSKCDTPFLEYVLGNAEVLKMVTITWENSCIEQEMVLRAKLIELPRASRFCEIHFVGNKYISSFNSGSLAL